MQVYFGNIKLRQFILVAVAKMHACIHACTFLHVLYIIYHQIVHSICFDAMVTLLHLALSKKISSDISILSASVPVPAMSNDTVFSLVAVIAVLFLLLLILTAVLVIICIKTKSSAGE